MRVDDLDTLVQEERDGSGPEHSRVSMADWFGEWQPPAGVDAERIRPASPERHGELLRAAHRQMPRPCWQLAAGLVALTAAAFAFSFVLVYVLGVTA